MPVISMFYGIIVRMFFMDDKEHKNKLKLVEAWMEIHKDELMADWKLAVDGQTVFKIDALK